MYIIISKMKRIISKVRWCVSNRRGSIDIGVSGHGRYQIKQKLNGLWLVTKSDYSSFTFDFDIQGSVEILASNTIIERLGLNSIKDVQTVGYQTTNILTNTNDQAWDKEK